MWGQGQVSYQYRVPVSSCCVHRVCKEGRNDTDSAGDKGVLSPLSLVEAVQLYRYLAVSSTGVISDAVIADVTQL